MSLKSEALADIDGSRVFFDNTTRVLEEQHAGYTATPESMTVAQQVAHVAQTIDWFREGGFEDRWRMDFEAIGAELGQVHSLAEARRMLGEAWDRLRTAVEHMPEEKLAEDIAENPILCRRPRSYTITGIMDHTAHHRGSLAVYARLAGKTPAMPYGEA